MNRQFPCLEISRSRLRHNMEEVISRCTAQGIQVCGVIKGCSGLPEVGQLFRDCGATQLASSRLEQIYFLHVLFRTKSSFCRAYCAVPFPRKTSGKRKKRKISPFSPLGNVVITYFFTFFKRGFAFLLHFFNMKIKILLFFCVIFIFFR